MGTRPVSGGPLYAVVREVAAAAYDASARDEEREEVHKLIAYYRDRVNQPRSPDEPPRGSPEALLRHVGVISEEEGDESDRAEGQPDGDVSEGKARVARAKHCISSG